MSYDGSEKGYLAVTRGTQSYGSPRIVKRETRNVKRSEDCRAAEGVAAARFVFYWQRETYPLNKTWEGI